MPQQRFVEVLDVGSEASYLFQTMVSKTSGLASDITLNMTKYINATASTVDSSLVSLLESYNVSKDDVFEAIEALNLKIVNSTLAQKLDKPRPIPSLLMMVGSFLIVMHLVLVNVESKSIVRRFGNHAPDKSNHDDHARYTKVD